MNDSDTFATAAGYYKGRTAYSDKFFEELARALNITRESSILDLACGGGEVSIGLSRYAGQITGIDKSDAMLKNAHYRTLPNVTFYQQDLNQSPVTIETEVDIVTIGRAIPYLEPSVLKRILSTSLKHGGLVIICGAGLTPETPWLGLYQKIRQLVRQKKTQSDYHGMRKMQSIEFSYLGTVRHTNKARYCIDDILNNALSYASQTKAILKDIDSFTAILESTLAPFKESDGKLPASEISWGHIFRSNA